MARGATLVLFVALLMAGCVGDEQAAAPDTSAPTSPDGNTTTGPDRATGANATDALPSGPTELTLYVDDQGGFTEAEPTGDTPVGYPLPAIFPDGFMGPITPTAIADGGPPFDLTVTAATVVFYYVQDHAGTRDPNFPPFGLWWGTEQIRTFNWADGPNMVQAGQVVEVSVDLPLPPGGLVFPEALQHELWFVGTYNPPTTQTANPRILAWSTATPSRLDLVFEPVNLTTGNPSELLRERFTLEGGDCFGVEEPAAVVTFALDVPAEAVQLDAVLTRLGGQGQEDADIDLFGPTGNIVAGGHTPYGHERVLLHRPNLDAVGPGAWTARVNACGIQQGHFELVVTAQVADV